MTSRLLRCPQLCSQSVLDARIGGLKSDLLAAYPAVSNTEDFHQMQFSYQFLIFDLFVDCEKLSGCI